MVNALKELYTNTRTALFSNVKSSPINTLFSKISDYPQGKTYNLLQLLKLESSVSCFPGQRGTSAMEAAVSGEVEKLLVIPETNFCNQLDNNSDELQRDDA